ncbi:MAG TPA: hypothetical protein DIT13_12150 [Verrucomicrobiales bacterium]|nr:hypothetical protein [Verrucomicrobiales bacterium]HRJ07297.1 hypothetical protein [Prosthecobacter sp.]HRK13476.1 hypothetical protein [Prosthecobacter sp.]
MNRLIEFLKSRSPDERMGLKTIVEADSLRSVDIADALRWKASTLLEYHFQQPLTYYQVVQRVARRLEIRADDGDTVEELEKQICSKVFETMWNKMSDAEKQEFEKKIKEAAKENDDNINWVSGGSVAAAIIAGKMSGFAIYIAASTALSVLSTGLGLSLPFVAYTTVSRVISTVLGPVGWIGAGLLTAYQISGPAWQRVTSAVAYISMLRNTPPPKRS